MLDIQFIRDHADRIKQTAVQKKLNVPVDELIEVDQKRRELIQKIEGYRTERNQQTKAIGELAREKKKKRKWTQRKKKSVF